MSNGISVPIDHGKLLFTLQYRPVGLCFRSSLCRPRRLLDRPQEWEQSSWLKTATTWIAESMVVLPILNIMVDLFDINDMPSLDSKKNGK